MTPSQEHDFAELVDRLRAGDPAAAQQIFQQYSRRLIGLARKGLGDRLQSKVSPESVVQSVFGTFFRRCQEDRFQLDNPQSLWALLMRITLNKCGHRLDYWLAARRDPSREQEKDVIPDDSAASWEAIAREPTPDEAVMLEETLAHALEGVSERDRRILELHMQGESGHAIAQAVSRSRRTVERSLERIRLRLEHLCEQAAQN